MDDLAISKNSIHPEQTEIIMYQTEDGLTKIDVRMENETVWLTQAQMAELHATLQAQGIKVEAVEVTVATHEFEQNLDGNASANAQMQEQNDSQSGNRSNGGRRNLDQSTLEGIGGQLTEEESLAAQMMRDNGGSVDYTA